MSTVAKSLIWKIYRNWLAPNGIFTIRRIELALDGEILQLPGWAKDGVVTAASDSFSSATLVNRGGIWAAETDLFGYSLEANEPDHSGISYVFAQSGWFRWTAPKSGTVYVDTRNSVFPEVFGENTYHVIAVYTGDNIDALTLVDSSYNNDYEVSYTYCALSFQAVEGQEYKIAIADNYPVSHTMRLNLAMVDFYQSFNEFDVIRACKYAFLPYGETTGSDTRYNLVANENTCDTTTGYIAGKDYVQFVAVFPEDVEFDSLVVRNGEGLSGNDADTGVREVEIYITNYEVIQADAENDSAPIPDEILAFDTNVGTPDSNDLEKNLNDEDIIIPIDTAPHGVFVGIGIGVSGVGAMTLDSAEALLGIGIGLDSAVESKSVGGMKCGLAIGVECSGAPLFTPAEFLAGFGIGVSGEADSNDSAILKAGICVACMAEGKKIYKDILTAAIGVGVLAKGASASEGSLSACIGVGVQCGGRNGTALCKATGFNDISWF